MDISCFSKAEIFLGGGEVGVKSTQGKGMFNDKNKMAKKCSIKKTICIS